MRALLGLFCVGILPLAASAQDFGPGSPEKTVQVPRVSSGSSFRPGYVLAIAQGYDVPSGTSSFTGSEENLVRNQGAYESDVTARLNRYERQAEDLRLRAQDFPARDREGLLRDADEMEKKSREVRGFLNDLDTGLPGVQRETREKIDREIGELERLYQRTGSANNWGAPFIQ